MKNLNKERETKNIVSALKTNFKIETKGVFGAKLVLLKTKHYKNSTSSKLQFAVVDDFNARGVVTIIINWVGDEPRELSLLDYNQCYGGNTRHTRRDIEILEKITKYTVIGE